VFTSIHFVGRQTTIVGPIGGICLGEEIELQ